jgi:hypothetical protein
MAARSPLLLAAIPLALALAAPLPSALAAEPRDEATNLAAGAWLASVDAGRYAESWDEAAALFRGAVSREQWTQAAGAARGPLGAMKARSPRSRAYKTALPGAPDGEYAVLEFQSVFANKKAAVETLTLLREKDGRWRAAGYFIR